MYKLVSIFIWHLQYMGPSYYAVFSTQEPLSIRRRIVETQHRHWATGGALDLNDNQFGHLSLSLWLSTLEQSSLQSSFRFECFFLSSNDSDDTQSQWHANVDQKLSFHAFERVWLAFAGISGKAQLPAPAQFSPNFYPAIESHSITPKLFWSLTKGVFTVDISDLSNVSH